MSFSTKTPWTEIKDFIDKTGLILNLSYKEFENHYLVWIDYEGLSLWTQIDKSSSDTEDFKNNYLPNTVLKKTILDDGTKHLGTQGIIFRKYLRKSCCQCQSSFANETQDHFTFSLLNSNNEVTTNEEEATALAIRFEPAFDYSVLGGILQIWDFNDEDIYVDVIGNPEIPAQMGGSIYIIKNEKYLSCNPISIESREAMPLKYIEGMHTNVIVVVVKHQAGLKKNMQLKVNFYA